jgi:hypothetical protein
VEFTPSARDIGLKRNPPLLCGLCNKRAGRCQESESVLKIDMLVSIILLMYCSHSSKDQWVNCLEGIKKIGDLCLIIWDLHGNMLSTLSKSDECFAMQSHVLRKSYRSSPQQHPILKDVLSILHMLIIDCFPGMLGLQSKKGTLIVMSSTKWSNHSSNIMPMNRHLNHVKSQTIVHLEKWMVVWHPSRQIPIN